MCKFQGRFFRDRFSYDCFFQNCFSTHNGLLPEEREVPLFVLGSAFSLDPSARPKQTDLCGTLCELLGIAHDKPLCQALLK